MSDPLPEITRVRGAGSARIGAVVVSLILVAVVVIGLSGQATPSAFSVPTAEPTARGLSNARPEPAATIAPAQSPSPTPIAPYTYGLALAIGNVRYVTIMSELSPGILTADLNFPSPPRLPEGTLEFSEIWKRDHVDAAALIARWSIDLAALAQATRTPALVLTDSSPPQPEVEAAPPPVSRGYAIKVQGVNDLLFSQLTVEITLGREPTVPGRGAAARLLGVSIDGAGETLDQILTPGPDGSFTATIQIPTPTRPITAHLLLYDVQATVSHNLWAEIADVTFRLAPRDARADGSKLLVDEMGPGYELVARTSGHTDGEWIVVTVMARRTGEAGLTR